MRFGAGRLAWGFIALGVVAACQPTGTNSAPVKVPTKAGKISAAGMSSPTTVPTQPAPTMLPGKGLLSTPPPPASPTPLPSGYVSPLPRDAFPPDLVATTTPGVVLASTPTPLPTLSPEIREPILEFNTLGVGGGSLTGVVVRLQSGQEPLGIAGVRITITSVTDGTQKASLLTAGNGSYTLGGFAYGTYFVLAAKSGYASDPKPTEVTLDFSHGANNSNFVLLPL